MRAKYIQFLPKDPKSPVAGPTAGNIAILIIVSMFLVAGCSMGKLLSNSSTSGPDANRPADVNRPAVAERRLKTERPLTMKYADLEFTVNKAVFTNRIDDELPIDNSRPEIADITFSVVNTLQVGVRIESGMWKLRLGDGSVYSKGYQDLIQPRDTKYRIVSFRVPANSQWAGAQITLDEMDKEPASLNLDGPQPQVQFPANIPTDAHETITKDPELAYTITKATLDLDAYGKRAALDKRYLNITVRVTDKGVAGGGGYFLPEFFRLITDGSPSAPENASDSALDAGGTQDYSMSYVVPKNISMVDLEVGKTGIQKTAKIHLDFEKLIP